MSNPELGADKKFAYRHLIYWGLLDIRTVRSLAYTRYWLFKPAIAFSRRKRVEARGALADWLHNIAMFSRNDFKGFDESRAWLDYDEMDSKFGKNLTFNYRMEFDRVISEFNSSKAR